MFFSFFQTPTKLTLLDMQMAIVLTLLFKNKNVLDNLQRALENSFIGFQQITR